MDDTTDLDSLKEKMSSSLPSDCPLRTRKLTGPSSSNFSMVSANDHISSLREGGTLLTSRALSASSSSLDTTCSQDTPAATPTMGRRGMGSTSDLGGLSRSSSTLSLASTGAKLSPVDSIVKHLRDRLLGELFSGWYTERRYIEAVERYRDVVLVDSVEDKVIRQARYAIRKSGKILAENSFVGLTVEEGECRIYLSLGPGNSRGEANHAFGHYWFQIRGISFLQGLGFSIEVAVIRSYVASDQENCWRCKQRAKLEEPPASPVKIDSVGAALSDMKTRLMSVSKGLLSEAWDPSSWWSSLRALVTPSNIVSFSKFIVILVLAAFTGLLAGCKQMASWSLRVIHELAFLVDRSTPFALGALNILSKVMGGFYLLLAMIWRDVRNPRKPPPSMAVSPSPQLALQSPPGSFPRPQGPTPPSLPRQRAVPSHSAMDNMYSQGRTW